VLVAQVSTSEVAGVSGSNQHLKISPSPIASYGAISPESDGGAQSLHSMETARKRKSIRYVELCALSPGAFMSRSEALRVPQFVQPGPLMNRLCSALSWKMAWNDGGCGCGLWGG
jgi:hypothetical protein